MAESQSAISLVAEGEEDEPDWEYEYHETETEVSEPFHPTKCH